LTGNRYSFTLLPSKVSIDGWKRVLTTIAPSSLLPDTSEVGATFQARDACELPAKVGINGFGKIGKIVLHIAKICVLTVLGRIVFRA